MSPHYSTASASPPPLQSICNTACCTAFEIPRSDYVSFLLENFPRFPPHVESAVCTTGCRPHVTACAPPPRLPEAQAAPASCAPGGFPAPARPARGCRARSPSAVLRCFSLGLIPHLIHSMPPLRLQVPQICPGLPPAAWECGHAEGSLARGCGKERWAPRAAPRQEA